MITFGRDQGFDFSFEFNPDSNMTWGILEHRFPNRTVLNCEPNWVNGTAPSLIEVGNKPNTKTSLLVMKS